jgi:hypothetical protein
MKIYLSGGIKKTADDRKIVWNKEDMETIRSVLGGDVKLLDPQRNPERADSFAALGCDLNDIREADVIIVDARQKRGVGIGAEMMIAKTMGKPVVAVAPRNSHYRKDVLDYHGRIIENWEHPFVFGLSDKVATTIEEAAQWVKGFLEEPGKVKDSSVVEKAIEYFLDKRRGSE